MKVDIFIKKAYPDIHLLTGSASVYHQYICVWINNAKEIYEQVEKRL